MIAVIIKTMKKTVKYFSFLIVIIIAVITVLRVNSCIKMDKCKSNVRYISCVIAGKSSEMELPRSLKFDLLEKSDMPISYCPCCHCEYIYKPVTKNGEVLKINPIGQRVILWCPSVCHNNKRVLLLNSLEIRMLKDDDVDFSTQTIKQKDASGVTPPQSGTSRTINHNERPAGGAP